MASNVSVERLEQGGRAYFVLWKVVVAGFLDMTEDGIDVVLEVLEVFCFGADEVGAYGLVGSITKSTCSFDFCSRRSHD
jgi:hypothetical protein